MNIEEKDLVLIMNALIFIGCPDCCEDHEENDEKYVDLAIRIKKETGVDPDESIYIYGGIFEDEGAVAKIRENINIREEE